MTVTVHQKAEALAAVPGRIKTTRHRGAVLAQVWGSSGTRYLVTIAGKGESCTCPASGACHHIEAVRLTLERGEPMNETDFDEDAPIAEIDFDPETGEILPNGSNVIDINPTPEDPTGDQPDAPTPIPTLLQRSDAVPDTDPTLRAIATTEITYQTLRAIATTEFVPSALRGRPEAILAAVLYGRELGLGPMESLAHVDMIDGRPSPSAELLARLIRRAGHTIEVLQAADQACRLRGTRTDTGETLEVSFSIADAQRVTTREKGVSMRLADTKRWKEYTSDLLWARALTRLYRRLYPDVVGGGVRNFRLRP